VHKPLFSPNGEKDNRERQGGKSREDVTLQSAIPLHSPIEWEMAKERTFCTSFMADL